MVPIPPTRFPRENPSKAAFTEARKRFFPVSFEERASLTPIPTAPHKPPKAAPNRRSAVQSHSNALVSGVSQSEIRFLRGADEAEDKASSFGVRAAGAFIGIL